MREQNKWAFWALALAAFLVVCIPSTLLVEAIGRYGRFLSGLEPTPLRPVKVRSLPHRSGSAEEAGLQFVEFRVSAPKAKSVQLIGDFNGWRDGTLPLARQSNGTWELMLPLPRGRHRYLFVVDGERRPDLKNPLTESSGGRTASVKVIR